jgi:ABC-type lipoprotein export system ATPase subunit
MIELRDVSKTYTLNGDQAVEAVRDASLSVNQGEFLIITGRSGSGKTTLLNLVGGMTRPTAGQVLIDGVDLWQLGDREQSRLRSQKFGFIFQFPSLLPSLTVLENVALPATFNAEGSGTDDTRRAQELLELVGLAEKLHAYPRQLSAGQQQRVVVARALLNQPAILLADEPTSDLDEQTELEIMQLLQDVYHRTGITILLVTHTSQLVSYGTRALRMAAGAIINGST